MKAFKKHIFIFLFLIIGIFFVGVDEVKAGELNWDNVTIECIYEDGGAYTVNIGKGATNRNAYNLNTSKTNSENSKIGDETYVNNPYNASSHTCMSTLIRGTINQQIEGVITGVTYFKFGDTGVSFNESDFDGLSGWTSFWTGELTAAQIKENVEKVDEAYSLVSERYILSDSAGIPDYTLTYTQSSKQAIGSTQYIYFMFYGNTIIAETPTKTTLLIKGKEYFDGISVNSENEVVGIEDGHTIFINNPEARTNTDSSYMVSYSYLAGQVRYEVSEKSSTTHNREYVLFNTGLGTGDNPGNDLCSEIMPETALVIRDIIKYAQILVPVFLIVLTGLDIGKIVVAGNIEEDLPKQKKKIIGRLVATIVFFFLPLIATLLIDMLKETGAVNASDIQSIECIFE